MPHFVLKFNRTTREPRLTSVSDSDEALALLHAEERSLGPDEEAVLFWSRSEEDLRVTHSSYFRNRSPQAALGTPLPELSLADLEQATERVKETLAEFEAARSRGGVGA